MNKKYKWGIAIVTLTLLGILGYSTYQPQSTSCHTELTIPSEHTGSQYKVVNANFKIPNKILTNNLGEPIAFQQLIDQDKPVFVQFIFTSCPTICPVLSSHFAALQAEAIKADIPIQMVSISIDPEYDSPQRLQAYSEKFEAKPFWTFLTGTKENIIDLQVAFDNYVGNKMYHQPRTYLKIPGHTSWKTMDGFISGQELWEEYHQRLDQYSMNK